MKPGLRKVVALLLASATLFGGGALSTSTALADDLTVGQSAQIQTDTNANTDTGTNSNVNNDKNDTTPKTDVHTDTGVRAQQAPEAVKDVTVHDMLDTDNAYVSKLKLTDRATGTAPFDNDNNRGDDKDATNGIVRSFDTVSYDYEYTVTPDSTMDYYKRARVGFRFELPYDASKVTFDTDSMNWVDRTPGYEPKSTTETINGVNTQVYTCYRLLEPTSASPTVAPGTSAIQLAVKVRAAQNGFTFHPTVESWVAWNASNPTDTGAHKIIGDSPKDVTVSAKLALNVSLKTTVVGGGTYDFSTGDQTAPNKTRGKVKGRQLHVQVLTSMRWPDRTKGLKGIEAPSGNIGYTLDVSNIFKDDDDKHTTHQGEKQWQPILWDRVYGHDSVSSEHGRKNEGFDHNRWFPYSASVNKESVNNGSTTYDEGATTSNGTKVNVSFNGYDILNYPCTYQDTYWNYNNRCSTDFMSGTSADSEQQVAPLHMDEFTFILPTSTQDGKTPAQYYGKDQIGSITITDTSLTATSLSGMTLDRTDSNSNQTVTNDDTTSANWNVRLPGSFIQRILYTSMYDRNSGYWDAGTTGRWQDPESDNGSDRVLEGVKFGITSMSENRPGEGDGHVVGTRLIKWDADVMTPLAADDNPTQPYTVKDTYGVWGTPFNWSDTKLGDWQDPVLWGVRADGGNWPDDTTQAKADYDDLTWYGTYGEAVKHGTVVAAQIIDTHVWDMDNTQLAARVRTGVTLPMRVNDDTHGRTAQTTGQVDYWTQSQLAQKAGLGDDATFDQWIRYGHSLDTSDHATIVEQLGQPSLHYDGKNYLKAKFSDDGVYQGGDTGGVAKGDTLYVSGEQPHVGVTTSQKASDGKTAKTIYDLDKEQRYADWTVNATAKTGGTSTGGTYMTDYHATVTLPKGLSYVDGSSTVDGTYTEHDSGQQQGSVTGGTAVTPTVTRNKDGSTTLEYTVNGMKADGITDTLIRFTTIIGDASDPDNDAKNNQQYTVHTEIRSKRWMGAPRASLGQTADYTIKVSRTHASALATRAKTLLNETHSPLGFKNMLGNFSRDAKPNPYAVDVMPSSGLGQSSYHGTTTMTGLTVKASDGASLTGTRVYFTTDPKWRNMDATKITREQVEQWTQATMDANGKVTIPDGCDKPVAWAFTSPSLPANARYDFTLSLDPTGNHAADIYMNRWTDGDNKVDALTQIVERKVNGVAWFDYNHNGVRESNDRLLAGVNVTLLDKNGRTVTDMDGKPCTAVTDQNGHYELTTIPSGSGFKLRFTPKTGTTWHGQHVTVKNAKEASEATDSDSDEEDDANGNMTAGTIQLKDFPALDKMTTAVYEDPNEDHGMYGTLMPSIPVTFKAVKVLNGRPNGAWTDKDKYVADITPLSNAPKHAVPSTITFTNNKTQTFQIKASEFPSEGTYQYEVKERKGDNAGVTYDGRTWILTVTIKDDMNTFDRHATVNVSCDGVQSDTIQFTNTYAPKDAQTRIVASKLFKNADKSATKITDFQFDLYANDKATGTPIQTVNASADGTVAFAPLLFTKAKLNGKDKATFHYSVRERNTGAAGVKYDDHYDVWTVIVTDDNSGQLKLSLIVPPVTIGKDGKTVNGGQFVNSYSSQPVTVTPKATKVLDNPARTLRLLNAGEFTFELRDKDGKTIQSKTNNADGTVSFDKLTYNTVGDHDYRIVEKTGQANGITYDKTVHTMHVNVADNGYGQLKANVSYDGANNAPTFTNEYNPTDVTATLTAHKTFEGKNASHTKLTDFRFQLFDNEKAVGVPIQTVNADQNGNVSFQPLTFTASQLGGARSKTFAYTVREVRQSAGGVSYDSHIGLWHITVTDDLTGRLKADVTESKANPATFTNTYKATPTSVQLKAHKTLSDPDRTGIALEAGQYEFKCVDDQTGKTVGTVKTNDQNGNVLFDAINYDTTGTHTYTISEVKGNRGGITYDTTEHHAKVDVTDDGEGHLQATVAYDDGVNVPEFVNTYKAQPATDTPTAVKKVKASEGNAYTLKGGDFSFTLHQQSAPENTTVNADQTKTNDQQGNIGFDPLTFNRVGTYVFTLSEDDTNVAGISKDGTVETITYKVKDVNHDGQLKVTSKTITPSSGDTSDKTVFTNTYNPKGVSYTIGGVKHISNADPTTSRVPKDGEFTFQLSASDGTPMPEGSKNGVKTVANKGTGFDFGAMDYAKPGVYTYHVKEVKGKDNTIGYSTQSYDVTVTVTDENGMLTASADRKTTDIRFDNTYTPTPVDVRLEASKRLTGRAMNDDEFSAELRDGDGNLLQSKAFVHKDGDKVGEGSLSFESLKFDRAGVYTYTVGETQGQAGGVTYDATVHTVTITVTENTARHALTATTVYSNGKAKENGIRFDNTYQPEDVTVGLTAHKTMTGRGLKADEFEFELVDEDGKVLDTVKNDENGDIEFQPLTYRRDNDGADDTGGHRYVIREKNTGEKNVTYDKTEHHVTVTVSDNLQGSLTAKVEYDPADDSVKDSSTMLVYPTVKSDKTADGSGEGEDGSDASPSMVTTTGTRPEFVNSYIPPVTPAIVKAIRQLAKTGVNMPTVALAVFTLLGVGLAVVSAGRRRHVVTPRHGR